MRLSTKLLRIRSAIKSKLIAEIKYHDIPRVCEIHTLGYNFVKEPLIRVFEKTKDGEETKIFKTYLVSDIQSLTLSKDHFTQSVTKPTDSAMKRIILTTYNGKKK